MKLYGKALLVGTKAAEGGQQVYTFRATTEAIDRQGEIVTLDGWDFADFEANPVILDSHNYNGIENIVGRAIPPLRLVDDAWEADIIFSDTPKGRLAKQLVDEGNLRAVSVGFNSKQREGTGRAGDPVKHVKKSMLEISVVPVPANQEALRTRGLVDEIGDGIESIAKAGRVLSRKNEQALRDALEMIQGVLSSLGEPSDEGKGTEPETAKGIEADLSGLLAFVAESK